MINIQTINVKIYMVYAMCSTYVCGSPEKLGWSRIFTRVLKISLAPYNVEKEECLGLSFSFLVNSLANSHQQVGCRLDLQYN